jgi:NAD(P)-dependent dehydrogenase (short-subunit alcohol dehydrogenase family)
MSRVVAITGGSKGIGRAVAEAFGREGNAVAVAGGSDAAALEATVEAIRSSGGPVHGALVDVRSRDEVEAFVAAAEAELGPIEVAVTCAGTLRPAPFLELTDEQWAETIDVHVKGTFLFLQAVARSLVAAGRPGSLITLTSFGGVRAAAAGLADYAAAKGAVISLTRAMARELLPHRITVNSVLPAAETQMTDTLRTYWHIDRENWNKNFVGGSMPQPDEIVEPFLFLASPGARHITGQVLTVDAGFGL